MGAPLRAEPDRDRPAPDAGHALDDRDLAGAKLAAGVLLMASPYLLLEASAALPVVIVVLLVVVLGEMLWAPASEALIANLAPPGLRGMYLGTANAASWLGLSLAPAIGLQTRAAFGDAGMWILIAFDRRDRRCPVPRRLAAGRISP